MRKKFKNLTVFFISLLMVLSFSVPLKVTAAEANKEIIILSFNDFHGSLKEDGKNVGAAKLAGEIKRIKSENPDTIVVSGGDLYQGSAISNLTYGKPVSEFLKSIGLTASAIGNHEFDWGYDRIEKWGIDGGFDFLASNIYDKKTKEPVKWAKPYKIVNAGGIKIGFIGLATVETLYKTKPENVKDFDFRDAVESAKLWADKLKSGSLPEGKVDVVIALSHLGSSQDGKTKEITGEAADLCSIETIDGVISAHTHKSVAGKVNGKPIVQGYYNGRALAKLIIKLNEDGKVQEIVPENDELYKRSKDLSEDPEVKEIFDRYNKETSPMLDEVIGTTATELPHTKTEPSMLGEWVCDVMKKTADTQIAVTNGGGLRVSIPKGDITVAKMYELMPFDNTLVTMELTGEQLKGIIEHGIMNENVGWIQLSGVKVYYDDKKEAGSRISSMRLLDGTKIEMDKVYTVVTNDFMADNGDDYNFKGAKNIVDTGLPIRDALIKELREVKNVDYEKVGYIILGEDPENNKYVEVTASVLNLRTAPEGKIVGNLKEGSKVQLLGEEKDWYKVSYNDNVYFISKKYAVSLGDIVEATKVVSITAKKGLRIRSSYSEYAGIKGVIKYDEKVNVYGENGDWYLVNYNGIKGYVFKKYTK